MALRTSSSNMIAVTRATTHGRAGVRKVSLVPVFGNSAALRRCDRLCASTAPSGGTEEAWRLLVQFSQAEFRGGAAAFLETPQARDALREAILAAYSEPYTPAGWVPGGEVDVLVGVLAGDARLGVRALRDWCAALGLPFTLPLSRVPGVTAIAAVQGPVYIKLNSKAGVCYLSSHQGRDRGVLLQLGQRQLGHFPLGLWDEGKDAPPPPLA